MRANKSQKLLLLVGLTLPFVALAVSWPQSTHQAPGRAPGSAPPREFDNKPEPLPVVLTNNNGQLEVMVLGNTSSWTDVKTGRTYRATITVQRKAPK